MNGNYRNGSATAKSSCVIARRKAKAMRRIWRKTGYAALECELHHRRARRHIVDIQQDSDGQSA